MEVVETRTIEDKMVDISICSSLSTPSETMTPSFDWSGLSLERVATFKDAMALRCCAFAPNRDELIFGSNGSSLRLASNLAEHRESILPQFTLDQVHEASVYCCAYSSDGELLATGSNDKMVKFIARGASLESDEPQLSVTGEMGRHEATVRKVAFLPSSSRLIGDGFGVSDGNDGLYRFERTSVPMGRAMSQSDESEHWKQCSKYFMFTRSGRKFHRHRCRIGASCPVGHSPRHASPIPIC